MHSSATWIPFLYTGEGKYVVRFWLQLWSEGFVTKREYSTADTKYRFKFIAHMEEEKLDGCEKVQVCQQNGKFVTADFNVILDNDIDEDDDGDGDDDRRRKTENTLDLKLDDDGGDDDMMMMTTVYGEKIFVSFHTICSCQRRLYIVVIGHV
jgi:hypothetical protein